MEQEEYGQKEKAIGETTWLYHVKQTILDLLEAQKLSMATISII